MEQIEKKKSLKEEQKRRKFMKQVAGLGVLGLASAGGIWAAKDFKPDKARLRPPGAVPEDQYLALKNEKVTSEMIGRIYDHTKVITPEERQSRKVEVDPNEPEKVILQKELLQKLSKQEGKVCTLCAELCPFEPDPTLAIGMISKDGGLFPEIREACVGCGACVELCPTKVLQILPGASYADVYQKNKGAENA